MASHVALSTIMAIFPFMIFGTALASYLGADAFSETAVHLIFDTWPQTVAEPIAREVENVLTQDRFDLLTIGVLAAAFFRVERRLKRVRISLKPCLSRRRSATLVSDARAKPRLRLQSHPSFSWRSASCSSLPRSPSAGAGLAALDGCDDVDDRQLAHRGGRNPSSSSALRSRISGCPPAGAS